MKHWFLLLASLPLLSGAKPAPVVVPIPTTSAFIADLETVVRVVCSAGATGTGFYVGDGFVITANHVVAGSQSCTIGGELALIGYMDEVNDVAVLITENKKLKNTYTCDPYRRGELYYAVGWANGEQFIFKAMVGSGENIKKIDLPPLLGTAVLFGEFFEGMSGGPVFDSRGAVVGVVNGVSRIDSNVSMSREMKDTRFCQPNPKP